MWTIKYAREWQRKNNYGWGWAWGLGLVHFLFSFKLCGRPWDISANKLEQKPKNFWTPRNWVMDNFTVYISGYSKTAVSNNSVPVISSLLNFRSDNPISWIDPSSELLRNSWRRFNHASLTPFTVDDMERKFPLFAWTIKLKNRTNKLINTAAQAQNRIISNPLN